MAQGRELTSNNRLQKVVSFSNFFRKQYVTLLAAIVWLCIVCVFPVLLATGCSFDKHIFLFLNLLIDTNFSHIKGVLNNDQHINNE